MTQTQDVLPIITTMRENEPGKPKRKSKLNDIIKGAILKQFFIIICG